MLGCLKISSCSGQAVTYSAHIDTRVSFQAVWDKTAERLAINIKPVETTLDKVNVAVCFLNFCVLFYSTELFIDNRISHTVIVPMILPKICIDFCRAVNLHGTCGGSKSGKAF